MVDYKTFKKEYLTEWVDRSQAARKAAEELANKEVKPSLRDIYKSDINDKLLFDLDGHTVEFKGENEKNPNDLKYNFFTYKEAMERFGKPNKDGWRLPTEEEFEALRDNYSYEFKDKQGVFDNRLYLPAAGNRSCSGGVDYVGSFGNYLSSTPNGPDEVLHLCFESGRVYILSLYRCYGFSVRLVREVK